MKLFQKISNKYYALLAALPAALVTAPARASNRNTVSGVFENVKDEASAILPIIMYLGAAFGAVIVVVAIWTAISAKRNREPLTWQVWGIIGGAMLTIAGAIVGMVASSLGVEVSSEVSRGLKL